MIEVLTNFGGRLTKERRIVPGVYADNDPRLFGLAAYLIEHKFAVRLDEPAAQEVKDDEPILRNVDTSASRGKGRVRRNN